MVGSNDRFGPACLDGQKGGRRATHPPLDADTAEKRNYSGSASDTSEPGNRPEPPAIGTTMYCRPSCM